MNSRFLVALVLVGATSRAHADPADADRLAKVGETMAASGDYVGAATKYREAFRADPRPELVCNVGVAYYKAKDLARAQRYLDECITTGTSLEPAFIANVKTVLGAVEQKLVAADFKPVSFIVQPPLATTTFASGVHDEPLTGRRRVWLPFGRYRVTVHADGFTDRALDITAENRDPAEYPVELQALVSKPDGQQPPPPDPVKPPDDHGKPLPEAPPAQSRSLLAPIIASASTGVLGGIALGFYFAARSSADAANGEVEMRAAYESAANEARSRQYISWGLGAAAGAAAITAGVLWYRATRTPSSHVEIGAAPGHASLSFVGRW